MMDDKIWVIFSVTVLGCVSIFFPEADKSLLTQIVTGLFGIAVGKTMVTSTKEKNPPITKETKNKTMEL